MVYDTGVNTATDFTNITETTNLDTIYGTTPNVNVTDGRFAGYFIMLRDIGSFDLSNEAFFEVGGFIYLTDTTTLPYFKRWNGTGWGDNNKFEITDNQDVLTDDNGNTVLYGTASFNTQYFIVDE